MSFLAFFGARGSSSAEKEETRQGKEATKEDPPESHLQSQQEEPESQLLLETQVAFQSPEMHAVEPDHHSPFLRPPLPPPRILDSAAVDEAAARAIPAPRAAVHFPPPPPRTLSSAAVDEAAARAIPAPTVELNWNSRLRSRSLSKMFTVLPSKPLPSYPQMVIDQMEYLMQAILLETNPMRVKEHFKNLSAARETFISLPGCKKLLRSGRLHSRLLLTSLAADAASFFVDADGVADSEREGLHLASDLNSDDWNSIQESLISLKGILLRQDANAAVVLEGADGAAPAPSSDILDENLATHIMMTVDYWEVIRLLAVHVELASLNEKLEEISDWEKKNAKASSNSPSRKSPNNSERSINRAVEKAVNKYNENLSRIFPPDEAPTTDEEVDDGIEIDDHSDTNNVPRENVPKELTSFLLTDLYSPKAGMVDRLLMHVQSITSDASTPALIQPGIFSYANLQNKLRALLIKWSESILEIPTLVRLGYGGVPSPIVDKDEDDVSSWGGDNDEDLEEHFEHNHERRKHISRSRSLTRILNATMRGQSVSVTGEEKDMIAQLAAAAAAASGPSQQSGSSSAEVSNSGHHRERSSNGKAPVARTSVPASPVALTDAVFDRRKDPPPQAPTARTIPPEDKVGRVEPSSRGDTLAEQTPSDDTGSRRKKTQKEVATAPTQEKASASVAENVSAVEVAAPYSDSDSDVGRRKVVKAGRRLMASLAKAEQHVSESDDEEPAVRKSSAKRMRDDDRDWATAAIGKGGAASDDSSVEPSQRKPVKLSRRLNDWMSRPGKRTRTGRESQAKGDSLKGKNALELSKMVTTPKKKTTRLEWRDSEDERSPVGSTRKRNSTAYSPNKRRSFTAEEADAVREGVAYFGLGNWKEIQEGDPRLKGRNKGQVKDKYRTMLNRGEI